MERESFENQAVADILNKGFVSVKVDREERPDVDRVYMTYIQAISGGGGWPMSVFLTPSLEPIVGGTYFPPEDMYGRPGFTTVLKKVSEAWQNDRSNLLNHGSRVMQSIANAVNFQDSGNQGAFPPKSAEAAIHAAFQQLAERFDEQYGGFSTAPKFPRISEVNLLLVKHLVASGNGEDEEADSAMQMADLTLQKMAAGGIYDHIGGGFARYSVDEKWHVPHFEKMLYDNPQIVQTYLAAFQMTGLAKYARVARGVLDYLLRDMQHPGGGYYSAEDADSLDTTTGEKKEGEFYVWTKDEIDEILGGPDSEMASRFCKLYHVKPNGNANLSKRSDPHGEFVGKNVLIDLSQASLEEEEALSEARRKLHIHRANRPRPHLDDKIVCGWNGMAIGAFAVASRALANEITAPRESFPVVGRNPDQYLEAAVKAAEFVEANLWDSSSKRLKRSFCKGPSDVEGFDNDYAFLIAGLLDLFTAGGDTKWLRWALELQDCMDSLFWDSGSGGYFSTTGLDPSIKLRMKEDQDGAEPAASSIAISNLLRLSALCSSEQASKLQEKAVKALSAFSDRLRDAPIALTQMCCSAFLLQAGPLRQVILAGEPEAVASLHNATHAVFCPDKVVIPIHTSNSKSMEFWKQHNPEVHAMAASAKGKQGTAFICQNFTCRAPTSSPGKVKELLSQAAMVEAAPKAINLAVLDHRNEGKDA